MPIHGTVEGRWSSGGGKPADPTPESLALVYDVRRQLMGLTGWHLPKEEAARRIDAHVAKRAAAIETSAYCMRGVVAEYGRELVALRAAADAMAREVEIVLDMLPCNIPELDDALAAYRALSPEPIEQSLDPTAPGYCALSPAGEEK